MNQDHHEGLEFSDRSRLRTWQSQRLRLLIEALIPANSFWTERLLGAGIDPRLIQSVDDLELLPFTTKADFVTDQATHPPYGRNLTFRSADYSRLHQTSGTTTGQPLRWLDTPASWNGMLDCWTTIYRWMTWSSCHSQPKPTS